MSVIIIINVGLPAESCLCFWLAVKKALQEERLCDCVPFGIVFVVFPLHFCVGVYGVCPFSETETATKVRVENVVCVDIAYQSAERDDDCADWIFERFVD